MESPDVTKMPDAQLKTLLLWFSESPYYLDFIKDIQEEIEHREGGDQSD